MIKNDYSGVVDADLVQLIDRRAKRMGFSGHDLDDLRQRITLVVADFEYDASRSNGASLRTALTSVIDQQLRMIRRSEARYRGRVAEGGLALDEGGDLDELARPDPTEAHALKLDVREAVGRLTPREQAICQELQKGLSIRDIARQLKCRQSAISQSIQRIRERFASMGLHEWL